jgi:ligand-binding sensor domain-containing protein
MAIILSISEENGRCWAAGPNGLFALQEEQLLPMPQPMERLACTLVLDNRILVGGGPHGVAYSPDGGNNWQAAWMSSSEAAILSLAADPDVEHSGVVLAASEGAGILRTTDRGGYWTPCNFGLRNYTVLSLAWAPAAPAKQWPRREVVFAGTEEGLYRSPNGGRAWKRAACDEAAYQIVVASPDFQRDGVVLAGTEGDGLWRSQDGGRTFTRVEDAPEQVNALCAYPRGWLLSDVAQLWHSDDGIEWRPITESEAALVLRPTESGILAGSESGLVLLDQETLAATRSFELPLMA